MEVHTIPDDHVGLCLMPANAQNENGDWFYLDIPIDTIETLCLKPRKYLLYLAWCILGLDVGYQSLTLGLGNEHGEFDAIDDDGDLESGGIYALIPDPPTGKYSFQCYMNARFSSIAGTAVVDLEVIKTRTAVASETTSTRNRFRQKLLQRDTCCVFTRCEPEFGEGLDIIPYKRSSEVRSPVLC